MTIQEKMKRLDNARQKADEIARKKERLSGQVEAKRKRVEELEAKANAEFNCEISEIPNMVEELDKEATEALKKAEKMLGLSSEDKDF